MENSRMRPLNISQKELGDGKPTFIIAEAGINHNGNSRLARELIEGAASSGADAIKFQIYKTEEFCSKSSDYFELFKSLELGPEEWIELASVSKDAGIIFTASVFGEESADLYEGIEKDSGAYKIASGDITHLPFVSYVAGKKRPTILSTGMATIGEIDDAVAEFYRSHNEQVALLHCISDYPTAYQDVNLRTIQLFKDIFKTPVGFSDHTLGTLIPAIAVSFGANIIEKHFTLNKGLAGPDHKFSVNPNELRDMVQHIRIAEDAAAEALNRRTQSEDKTKMLTRRSITAKAEIPAGCAITADIIKIVRPGGGIEPRFHAFVIGRVAKKRIAEDATITWNDI